MSKTILVVDDDAALRDVVADCLLEEGYEVAEAVHGADALEQLRAGLRPDLILLDLMMPVMDGWQLREELLADPALADIPVVVLTAAGTLKRDIPARQILRKPFRLDDLYDAVHAP